MEITILCKVVDNFGDIGVSYRLARGLKSKYPDCIINLIVDNLSAFARICNSINENLISQKVNDINVYDWNAAAECTEIFYADDGKKIGIILECFQCGRPEWLEKILFETKLNRTVQIIMIDYLTAEKYAEDFHCLQSLTRSAKVQKVNFMPGFTDKTGGLITGTGWESVSVRKSQGAVLVFTYKRNFQPFFRALYRFLKEYSCDVIEKTCESGRNLSLMQNGVSNCKMPERRKVYIARGQGFKSLCDSFENVKKFMPDCDDVMDFSPIPFVNQEEWDSIMKSCSVLFIRGEESLSRACLSGIPFVWHAYPQSDEYQLVKVNALLERLRCCFSEQEFCIVEKAWHCFNMPEKQVSEETFEKSVYDFLCASDKLAEGFRKFALQLQKNGDLCDNLMTFIRKKCIM